MNDEQTEQTERWEIRTLENAYKEREPTRYIVDKFLATHTLNVIYGAPASMKSMLLADMCLHVVAGTDWLPCSNGVKVEKSPVLWIDMDNGTRKTDERFDAIGRALKLPEDSSFYYVSMPSPTLIAHDLESMLMLKSIIEETQAAIVVIDNLGLITGDVEENSAKMAQIMGNLRTLAERTGCALVIVHHQRKGGANGSRSGDALRGHSSIEAAVDLALHVVREDNSNQVTIRSTKTRGVDVPTLTAQFEYEHHEGTNDLKLAWFFGVDPTRGQNSIHDTILFYVEENEQITKTKLIELVNDALKGEASKAKIRAFLDDMLNLSHELVAEKGEYNAVIIRKR